MSVRSDAELARAWQAGDPAAFAEVYEKYSSSLFGVAMGLVRDRAAAADAVHDTFVRAAQRIGGLREADRLRAWLFAILRNEATDVLRGRGRESAQDVAAMSEQFAADLPEPHTELSRSELSDVVWSAAEALQQRDREVLELHVRAGLEAGDLADALGVTTGHAAVLLSRMRDRMEKAIGALLIARLGRRECTTLDALLARWDGRFTLDVRSRVTRHVESCAVCTRGRMQLASYQRLAPAMLPVFLVPEGLRHQVLSSLELVSARTALGLSDGAGHAGRGAGSGGTWSWRADGFPQPRPSGPGGAAGDDLDDEPAGGSAGTTVAAAASAALLAAGLGSPPPQDVVDPWSLPPEPLPPPGGPLPPVPRPRSTARVGLLAAAGVALLVAGGIGTWKVVVTASPGSASTRSTLAGGPQVTGGGASTDPGAGTTTGAGPTTSGGTATTGAPGTAGTGAVSTGTTRTTSGGATTQPSTSPPSGASPSPGTTPSPATTTPTTTSTTPAAAAHLAAGPGSLGFGRGTSAQSTGKQVTLTNDGGHTLTWSASLSGAGFSVSPGSGSLGAGRSATLTVTLNRSGLAEGPVSGTVNVTASTGQSFHVSLTGSVNNPPVISVISFTQSTLSVQSTATSCPYPTTSGGSVVVADDTTLTQLLVVTLSWNGPNSPERMTWDGKFYGTFGPFTTTGAHSATVTATDQFGNSSTATIKVTVTPC
jgi:RNA polymerase sigma factor (sigma-70 family)